MVGGAAAGGHDVELFAGGGVGDGGVGGVEGAALGLVGGDGVAEVEVFGGVVGGQGDVWSSPSARWTVTSPSALMAVTVQVSPFLTQLDPVVRVRLLRRVMTVSPTLIGLAGRR